jgi:hypothetical protein
LKSISATIPFRSSLEIVLAGEGEHGFVHRWRVSKDVSNSTKNLPLASRRNHAILGAAADGQRDNGNQCGTTTCLHSAVPCWGFFLGHPHVYGRAASNLVNGGRSNLTGSNTNFLLLVFNLFLFAWLFGCSAVRLFGCG